MKYEFLDKINNPSDLRILSINDLDEVSEELRHFLIDTVSQCGGHFGASLGAVELTIALHYSFNTPEDKIIWDVGHQCYGHKVITGRRMNFILLEKKMDCTLSLQWKKVSMILLGLGIQALL